MISDKAKQYLISKYGENEYNWDISDFHLKSILQDYKPESYAELNIFAKKLIRDLEYIKAMQEKERELWKE